MMMAVSDAVFVHTLLCIGVLYYVSSTVNPILYNVMSNRYRRAFCDTLLRCVPRRRLQPSHRASVTVDTCSPRTSQCSRHRSPCRQRPPRCRTTVCVTGSASALQPWRHWAWQVRWACAVRPTNRWRRPRKLLTPNNWPWARTERQWRGHRMMKIRRQFLALTMSVATRLERSLTRAPSWRSKHADARTRAAFTAAYIIPRSSLSKLTAYHWHCVCSGTMGR